MTLRSHLLRFHDGAAEHHRAVASSHGAMAKLHARHSVAARDAYGKAAGDAAHDHLRDTADLHDELAGHCQDLQKEHEDHAARHEKFYKALESRGDESLPEVARESQTNADEFGSRDFQAVWGNRLQQVRPDGVHGVVPDIPTGQLIPRPGGPEVNTDAADPVLRKLFE